MLNFKNIFTKNSVSPKGVKLPKNINNGLVWSMGIDFSEEELISLNDALKDVDVESLNSLKHILSNATNPVVKLTGSEVHTLGILESGGDFSNSEYDFQNISDFEYVFEDISDSEYVFEKNELVPDYISEEEFDRRTVINAKTWGNKNEED